MSMRHKLLRGLLGGTTPVAPLVYLYNDEFTTDETAPLTSPRTCEPGPGTILINDPNNQIAISGSKLVRTGTTINVVGCKTEVLARSPGLAMCASLDGNWTNGFFGWGDTNFSINGGRGIFTEGNLIWLGSTFANIAEGQATKFAVIQRATGYFMLKLSSADVWRLLWVDHRGSDATRYAKFGYGNVGYEMDNFRVLQLDAPWTGDAGIYTGVIASASAGDVITQESNAFVEATWTAVTGETFELSLRRTDDDNRWIVRCNQAGGTMKLIERNAGTETERASVTLTWDNGTPYRIVATLDGQAIKTFRQLTTADTTAAGPAYASAAFNLYATGVKTSHAVTNLTAWPRYPGGAALAEMNKSFP